ncbi:MAG: hypothetical protein ACT4OZ_05355 [Gemmatimonadota bacterium]
MRRIALPLLMLLLFGPVFRAAAQESEIGPDRRYTLFLDRSYIFNSAPYRDLIFEAQIAPPLFLFQNTPRTVAMIHDTSRFNWLTSVSLSFSPMLRLRMLNEPSSPVRTPSFMPRLDFQIFQFRRTERGAGMDETEVVRMPVWLRSLHFTLGHHSNGQDGCLFTDETKINGKCREPAVIPQNREVNFVDGSFSTNYLRTAVEGARIWLDDNQRLRRQLAGSIAWEAHTTKGPGGVSERLRPLLGPQRLRLGAEFTQRTGSPDGLLRVDTSAEIFHSRWPGIPRSIVSARAEWTFDRVGGWGAMLRFYRGQDYYNLGFSRSLGELQFGIVFDAGRWLEFEIPERARSGETTAPARPTLASPVGRNDRPRAPNPGEPGRAKRPPPRAQP